MQARESARPLPNLEEKRPNLKFRMAPMTVRSPRPEVHVRSPTWRHPKSKALSVETGSPRSRLVQGETKHITFSPGAPLSHSKAADLDYAGKWTQKSSAEIAGSRHIEYMPPKTPPGLVPKPAASPLKYSGEPSDYYGESSHKTDMKNAGAQFIEYMAPKNPGEMRPKPTATPLRYSGESSQAKGAERGAAARAEAGPSRSFSLSVGARVRRVVLELLETGRDVVV